MSKTSNKNSLDNNTLIAQLKSIKSPTPETIKSTQEFLVNAIGNMKLNSKLNQNLLNASKDSDGKSTIKTTIQDLRTFSFKTRNFNQSSQALNKLSNATEATKLGHPIKEEDKITLKEFGAISDLAKSYEFLYTLETKGLIVGNEQLESLHKQAKEADSVIKEMNAQAQQELVNVGSGIITISDTKKKLDVIGKTMGAVDKLVNNFCKHDHSSILYANDNKKLKQSHINIGKGLTTNDVNLKEILYSDSYKIDVTALIPKEQHENMKNIYGEDWKNKVARKFQIIEKEIYTDSKKYSKLSAFTDDSPVQGAARFASSGLADKVPFGHKKIMKSDFKEIYDKVMEGRYSTSDKKMLCSEFTATAIITSLVELNKQITEDASGKGVQLDSKNGVVTIPFDKREDLTKIHPDRLLTNLKKYNCVEKVNVTAHSYLKTAEKLGKSATKFIHRNSTPDLPLLPKTSSPKLLGQHRNSRSI